jgi:hypothetical protein
MLFLWPCEPALQNAVWMLDTAVVVTERAGRRLRGAGDANGQPRYGRATRDRRTD